LQARTQPDFNYLKQVAKINNWFEIKKIADKKFKNLDFKKLAKDAEKFLFNRKDVEKIINFKKYFNYIVQDKI